MSKDTSQRRIEWLTVALVAAFFTAWLMVVLGHRAIPWPVQLVVLAYLGGLWMSIGHELLHGHPTPWNWVNTTVGFVPLSLWLPFGRYKTTHVQHHRSDLTDPFDDPETTYFAPAAWQQAGRWKRRYFLALRTTPVRFTIGVPRAIMRFWWRDAKAWNNPRILGQWAAHILGVVALCWWLFGVVGVSPWVYLFGFVFGGTACSLLRSFVEHCAVAGGTRSAVVKAGPVMSLLYLNINLHHTHHALPDVAWYAIPSAHRSMGSDEIAAQGAGLYPSYFHVLRQYFATPFCQPDHPLSPGARPYGSRGIR